MTGLLSQRSNIFAVHCCIPTSLTCFEFGKDERSDFLGQALWRLALGFV